MVKYKVDTRRVLKDLDLLHALSDKTRYDIMVRLVKKGELSACAIADNYSMSLPAVSKHLKILKNADLVNVTKDGVYRMYAPNVTKLNNMKTWLLDSELFWQRNLDSLAEYVENNPSINSG